MEMEHQECISPNLVFATTQMSDYSRNKYRLDTTSATIASAGQIITCNFPEASLLDLKSFRFYFQVVTTSPNGSGSGTDLVYAACPDDASTFVQKLEVYLNGVQVSSGQNEYNSMCRLVKIGKGSNDRNSSFGQLSANSFIVPPGAAANQTANLCISEWNGFLNDVSTRFVPTSLMGQIQVRITLAPNAVLVPINSAGAVATTLTANAYANAQTMSYTINSIRFSIDAISVCPAYNEMLSQQLAREGLLKLNYKEYYTFLASNILTNRFALSSSSIDEMWGSLRPSTYNQAGQLALSVPQTNGGGYVCNYLAFKSYDPDTNVYTPTSNLQYQWSLNNVLSPQYLAYVEDAMAEVPYVWDKVGQGAQGIIPTTRANFKTGFFQVPLRLNHPTGMGFNVRSGYNSRGVNSTMLFNIYGVSPTSTTGGGTTTSDWNNIVVVGTTAQLKIGLGRSLAIDF